MNEFGLSNIEDKWTEEKSESELTELTEDFYKNSASYVSELAREIEDSEDLRREILEEELNQVWKMVQEIYLLRILKITDSLFGDSRENLLSSERKAFDEIKGRFEDLKEELVVPVMRGESELRPPREISNALVLILSDIPEPITGPDMRYYGPFSSGEIANLPEGSANLLEEQGLARRLQVKEA